MTRQDITLQITLGHMSVEDSFRVTTSIDTARTVHDLMDSVFPDSPAQADEIQSSLDLRTNPDLAEMYQELQGIISQWRDGVAQVDFKSPSGSGVLLEDPVSRHVTPSTNQENTVHIVLEHHLDALAAYQHDDGNPDDLIQWMQGCVLIYFMDKHHFPTHTEPEEHTQDWRLLSIADELESLGLIAPSRIEDTYEITPKGRGFIGNLIAETESYIRRFDVFSDILPGRGLQPTVFGSGRGLDLRVQIFEAQGIDPYRAVFLLRMYDGTLDAFADSWRADIHEPEFFNRLLEPVVDHDRVNDDDVDWVIDQGVEHVRRETEDIRDASRTHPFRSHHQTE